MGTGGHVIKSSTPRLGLLHRTYSVPETVMRKYSLSQQRSLESAESGTATMPTPTVPCTVTPCLNPCRATPYPNLCRGRSKACQTSPQISANAKKSQRTVVTRLGVLPDSQSDEQVLGKSSGDSSSTSFTKCECRGMKTKDSFSRQLCTNSVCDQHFSDVSIPGLICNEDNENIQHPAVGLSNGRKIDNTVEFRSFKVLPNNLPCELTIAQEEIQMNNSALVSEQAKIKISKEDTLHKCEHHQEIGEVEVRQQSCPEEFCPEIVSKIDSKPNPLEGDFQVYHEEGLVCYNIVNNAPRHNLQDQISKTELNLERTKTPSSYPKEESQNVHSDQSPECCVTDCDICIAEGRRCCSLGEHSEIGSQTLSFTSPEMITTDDMKTSSDFTSSSVTLDQTVSDRTTSTQDSTLSITSITPESTNSTVSDKVNNFISMPETNSNAPLVIASESTLIEPIITPESTNSTESDKFNNLVITSESTLIQPITSQQRSKHYSFHQTESSQSNTPTTQVESDKNSNKSFSDNISESFILLESSPIPYPLVVNSEEILIGSSNSELLNSPEPIVINSEAPIIGQAENKILDTDNNYLAALVINSEISKTHCDEYGGTEMFNRTSKNDLKPAGKQSDETLKKLLLDENQEIRNGFNHPDSGLNAYSQFMESKIKSKDVLYNEKNNNFLQVPNLQIDTTKVKDLNSNLEFSQGEIDSSIDSSLYREVSFEITKSSLEKESIVHSNGEDDVSADNVDIHDKEFNETRLSNKSLHKTYNKPEKKIFELLEKSVGVKESDFKENSIGYLECTNIVSYNSDYYIPFETLMAGEEETICGNETDLLLEHLGLNDNTVKTSKSYDSFVHLCDHKMDNSNINENVCTDEEHRFYGNKTYELIVGETPKKAEELYAKEVQNKSVHKKRKLDNKIQLSENQAPIPDFKRSLPLDNRCRSKLRRGTQQEPSTEKLKYDEQISSIAGRTYSKAHGSELIIPRYSAIPRTVSMLVNTSSVDYSSDSDVSQPDSLEEGYTAEKVQQNWPSTKHDNRMVRGDAVLCSEHKPRKELKVIKKPEAYFVSLTGEEGEIKTESIPEKLKLKLLKRNMELKKHTSQHVVDNEELIAVRKYLRKYKPESIHIGQSEDVKQKLNEVKCSTENSIKLENSKNSLNQMSQSTQWEENDLCMSVDNKLTGYSGDDIIINKGDSVATEGVEEIKDENQTILLLEETQTSVKSNILSNDFLIDEEISNVLLDCLLHDEQELQEKMQDVILAEPGIIDETLKEKLLPFDTVNECDISSNFGFSVQVPEGITEKVFNKIETVSKSVQTEESLLFIEACPLNLLTCSMCYVSKSEVNINTDSCPAVEKGNLLSENSMFDPGDKAFNNQENSRIFNNLSDEKEDIQSTIVNKHRHTLCDMHLAEGNNKFHRSHCSALAESNLAVEGVANNQSTRNAMLTSSQKITMKVSGRRGIPSNRFRQRFEMIPEERSSCSMESSDESVQSVKSRTRRASVPSDMLMVEIPCQDISSKTAQHKSANEKSEQSFEGFEGSDHHRRHTIHGIQNLSTKNNNDTINDRGEQNRRHTIHGNLNINPKQNLLTDSDLRKLNLDGKSILGLSKGSRLIGKRPGVMIGRFRPINEETQVEKDTRSLMGELLKPSKGRAALAMEDQEELVTLSKGWINFYLLKDSQDQGHSSDSNDDEGCLGTSLHDDMMRRASPALKTVTVVGKPEDQLRQYTVQIHASPEPLQPPGLLSVLPELRSPTQHLRNLSPQTAPLTPAAISLPNITSPTSSASSDTTVKSRSPKGPCQSLPLLHRLEPPQKEDANNKTVRMMQKNDKLQVSPQCSNYLKMPASKRFQEMSFQSRSGELACSEMSASTDTMSSLGSHSESPALPSVRWPRHQTAHKRPPQRFIRPDNGRRIPSAQPQTSLTGPSWTVTVAGSSNQQPPPDVEMRLRFPGRQGCTTNHSDSGLSEDPRSGRRVKRGNQQALPQSSPPTPPSNQWTVSLRKQVKDKNEKVRDSSKDGKKSAYRQSDTSHQAHWTPKQTPKRGSSVNSQTTEVESGRSSAQSRFSFVWPKQKLGAKLILQETRQISAEEWCTGEGLLVTGLAITPERKPRVPTMSERDLTRNHHTRHS